LSRVQHKKPPKPPYKPTAETPFELIAIKGNIRVCAGCKNVLKDGPTDQYQGYDNFDETYCIRHKEKDFFYLERENKWLQKFENKHYHLNKSCMVGQNPNFDADNIRLLVELTTDFANFLKQRLK